MNLIEQIAPSSVDSERQAGPWAGFAEERGEKIPAVVLFGIGRSAWYQWVEQGQSASLLTYHPDRVLHMLLALNVPTEVHDCLATRALRPSDMEPVLGRRVLLELNRDELTAPAQASPAVHHRYCVWTTGRTEMNGPGAWPQVELEMPSLPAPVFIDGQTLARSWTFPSEDFFRYRFFVPAAHKIRWHRRLF